MTISLPWHLSVILKSCKAAVRSFYQVAEESIFRSCSASEISSTEPALVVTASFTMTRFPMLMKIAFFD